MKTDIEYLDATSSEELIDTHEKHHTDAPEEPLDTDTKKYQGVQPVYLVIEDRYAKT